MTDDSRLDEIIRLWPRLSDYWKDILVNDCHEALADARRQADLDRRYKPQKALVWPVYVTFPDEKVIYVCPTRDRAEQAVDEIKSELPDVVTVDLGSDPIQDGPDYESWR